MSDSDPPGRIETSRLILRVWSPDDASLLRAALDRSLDHLRPWMPWAAEEPRSLDDTRELLAEFRERFEAGEDFVYGIFDRTESEVLGGTGLHPRIGPGGLEIGYWIRVDKTGQGLATEAAGALAEAGSRLPGIDRIQIHCAPENVASRRIPEKLGFRLVETRKDDEETPEGELRDTLVFELSIG